MQIFETSAEISADSFTRGTVIAIGKFDGVHLGHRALLARISEVAAERDLDPVVFTFANNPLSLLRPDLCPDSIMSKSQRVDTLKELGVPACVILPFDRELAELSAEEFVEDLLVKKLHVRYLCVGSDFRFGHGGKGDPALLKTMGERLGFSVETIDNVEDPEAGRVSSSRIRAAVVQGDVALAARMMGHQLTLRGEVVRGDARGRELGFPTANLGGVEEGLRPADGVYAGWATVEGATYKAAISVGANITFEPEGEPRVEAYLLDFSGDLYGKQIEIRFVERLRGMTAFASVETLVARMHEDVRETETILIGAHMR